MPDSTLRERQPASKDVSDSPAATNDKEKRPSSASRQKSGAGIGVLDILRMLAGVALLSCAISYFVHGNVWWNRRPAWAHYNRLLHRWKGDRNYTLEELRKYDGTNQFLPIYIAVNGVIYDVSASPNFYGPGGGYHVFAGSDSSRAFVTGCFEEDKSVDMRGVEEMYMPKDLDLPPKLDEGATDTEKKAAKKLWKLRRERASRDGKAQAKAIVDSWQERYEDGMGGKYFRVGQVKLPDDWKERRGPLRNLCKRAAEQRPATNKWSTWDGDEDNLP